MEGSGSLNLFDELEQQYSSLMKSMLLLVSKSKEPHWWLVSPLSSGSTRESDALGEIVDIVSCWLLLNCHVQP